MTQSRHSPSSFPWRRYPDDAESGALVERKAGRVLGEEVLARSARADVPAGQVLSHDPEPTTAATRKAVPRPPRPAIERGGSAPLGCRPPVRLPASGRGRTRS